VDLIYTILAILFLEQSYATIYICERLLLEDRSSSKVGVVSFNSERSGLVWKYQNRRGDHAISDSLKSRFFRFPPLPCGVLLHKVEHWASEVQEAPDEVTVEIGEAQEGLNLLLVAWSWPLRYSGNFHGVHLCLSGGDDKSKVFNPCLCKLALVVL
jgi:hypothetical protein